MSTLMQSFLAALTLQLPDYFCCPFFRSSFFVSLFFLHYNSPLEALFIGIWLPFTHNLEKTFGLQTRSNLARLPILTYGSQARRLSSILMARRPRWLQARLSPNQIRLDIAMECIELILLG